MAEDTTGRSTRRSTSSGSGGADAAKGDVEEQWAKIQEQGFLGTSVDPHDNSEYSLESGPDSPAAVTDEHSRAELPGAGRSETTK